MNKLVLALALLAGTCTAQHNAQHKDWRAKHAALEVRMAALGPENAVRP